MAQRVAPHGAVDPAREAPTPRVAVETNGINVIAEAERKGTPAAAVLAVVRRERLRPRPDLRLVRARLRHLVLAGGRRRRGRHRRLVPALRPRSRSPASAARRRPWCSAGPRSASTATACPSVLSWVLTVGWETVLVSLATLATATVFDQLGWGGGTATKVVALLVVAALIVGGGVLGFDLIMRHADGDHRGHRRADRRLHRAGRRPHPLVRRLRAAQRLDRSRSSARWCS